MTDDKLELLLVDGIIDRVLGRLRGGKEADVWIVEHAGEAVAAKIYKERLARSFRNNADYKEGRQVADSRTQRAMSRGSRFGQAAAEQAWKSAEADALYKLHAAGVRAPAPVMFYEGVLLMQLVVDAAGNAAPRLIDAQPTAEQAGELYRDLRSQVVRMLVADLIHGDLSPYNVLLATGGPTIIDFPQTIAAAHNSRAEFFFTRDLENLRTHLAGFDPGLRASAADAREIWRAYVRRELTADFIPTGHLPEERPARPSRPDRQERAQEPRRHDSRRHEPARRADPTPRHAAPSPQVPPPDPSRHVQPGARPAEVGRDSRRRDQGRNDPRAPEPRRSNPSHPGPQSRPHQHRDPRPPDQRQPVRGRPRSEGPKVEQRPPQVRPTSGRAALPRPRPAGPVVERVQRLADPGRPTGQPRTRPPQAGNAPARPPRDEAQPRRHRRSGTR